MNKGLIKELRQRNVFKVALGYLIVCWLLAQVADLVLSSFDAPSWAMRVLLIAMAIGFPVAMAISWAFEVTPEGVVPESQVDRTVKISQESGRRLDFSILLILSVVIIFMGLERFVFSDRDGGRPERLPGKAPVETPSQTPDRQGGNEVAENDQTESGSHLQPIAGAGVSEGAENDSLIAKTPSVAVLPFTVMSTGPDDEYFANGFSEELINALSQLPSLMVTARTSAFHFKDQNLSIGEIANKLGVNYIVEGSVRRAGEQLRITAQLVRADDGFHLWSESYDRRTADTFAVQDDISIKVAEALNINVGDAERNRMQLVGVRNVDAVIAFQKGDALHDQARQSPDQVRLLRQANQHFEVAISHYPTFSDAYIHHSDLFSHILITTASGRLDGNINKSDTEFAAGYLRADLDNAIRYAKDESQRIMAELDRALLLGEWRGIEVLSEEALLARGCETAHWAQWVATPFGNASLARDAFQRTVTCDPLQGLGDIHQAAALLWLGDWAAAERFAVQRLVLNQHPSLVRSLAVALAMQGRFKEAEVAIRQHTKEEDERLLALALLNAIQGVAVTTAEYSVQLIEGFGPDDLTAQQLAAQRGDRNEANRLASQIDRRPFGYLVLLQAIYNCGCGAPFDLEATPVFARMLQDSGLDWPPVNSVSFPLKDW